MTRQRAPGAIDAERRLFRPPAAGLGRVCCYACDRNRGRPLLLVHDLRPGSSAGEMRPLFEVERWRRATYAVDLPGFGLSERPAIAYAPALFAAALAEVLRRLRREGGALDVAALGRGCEVAARVARDEPAIVRSLVMIEPFGIVSRRGETAEAIVAGVAHVLGESTARVAFSLLGARGDLDAPLGAIVNGPRGEQASMLYRALAVPVLVVHDATAADAATELETFLRGRANRFAVRVPSPRGMPHLDRRVETAAALDRFWQTLPDAARDTHADGPR